MANNFMLDFFGSILREAIEFFSDVFLQEKLTQSGKQTPEDENEKSIQSSKNRL